MTFLIKPASETAPSESQSVFLNHFASNDRHKNPVRFRWQSE
jgi:hypothetical protein